VELREFPVDPERQEQGKERGRESRRRKYREQKERKK
jgi:hypothetical protein